MKLMKKCDDVIHLIFDLMVEKFRNSFHIYKVYEIGIIELFLKFVK
jgi:hypothetical protein